VTLRTLASSALVRLYFGPEADESEYGKRVSWAAEGNRVIDDVLAAGAPCMITRLGSSELGCIAYYLRWREGRRIRPGYPASLKRLLSINAGVFPAENDSLDEFARLYLDAIRHADVVGVWFNRGEQRVISECCASARLVELAALNSVCYEEPWSAQLLGKTVLVVHPFAKSISSQYTHHRTELFADPKVLPEFELKTLIPPQTIAGSRCGFGSWFDALTQTCDRIGSESYDVALIGAGAYGLPIAAFVKGQGRQAVHMGGATQLLFGIKGRRWEREYEDSVVPLFNSSWVRPLPEETPEGAPLVEGGCYW
jgi:hypothetical protein